MKMQYILKELYWTTKVLFMPFISVLKDTQIWLDVVQQPTLEKK